MTDEQRQKNLENAIADAQKLWCELNQGVSYESVEIDVADRVVVHQNGATVAIPRGELEHWLKMHRIGEYLKTSLDSGLYTSEDLLLFVKCFLDGGEREPWKMENRSVWVDRADYTVVGMD